jgi:hypothetical protein
VDTEGIRRPTARCDEIPIFQRFHASLNMFTAVVWQPLRDTQWYHRVTVRSTNFARAIAMGNLLWGYCVALYAMPEDSSRSVELLVFKNQHRDGLSLTRHGREAMQCVSFPSCLFLPLAEINGRPERITTSVRVFSFPTCARRCQVGAWRRSQDAIDAIGGYGLQPDISTVCQVNDLHQVTRVAGVGPRPRPGTAA